MPVDTRYLAYCVAGTDFYDVSSEDEPTYGLASAELPSGWRRNSSAPWVHLHPAGVELPGQGWKVHVSAHPGNAEKVLAEIWGYCGKFQIPFKFLRSERKLKDSNVKYADRGSSGKFITIYPANTKQLRAVLSNLDARLSGEPGPYVLSDMRWRSGPLYVRYGGFTARYSHTEDGQRIHVLEDPEGNLVEDQRRPSFTVPEWVEVPDFLQEQIELNRGSRVSFPYQPLNAMHFSNGGGVYEAMDKESGKNVVLKEARPYAGLDVVGRDAVTRLKREEAVIERLAGLREVPELLGSFNAWDHHFLAMEKIEGLDLKRASMQRIPILKPNSTKDDTRDYVAWATSLIDQMEIALAKFHDRGVVVGDLHPKNIIVRDDSPVFLDFEFSGLDDPGWVLPQGAPGYRPPKSFVGPDSDLWALSVVKLDMFLPQAMLVDYEQGKVAQLAELAARRYGLPDEFVVGILDGMKVAPASEGVRRRSTVTITREVTPTTRQFLGVGDLPPWSDVCESMAQAVLASATPERCDRLFPGDIEQFVKDQGLGLAYGAAGVLHTLAVTGHGRHIEYERWLIDRLATTDPEAGFFNGLHGIAHALNALGHDDHARTSLERARRVPLEELGFDLFAGLAGAGLNLLHLAGEWNDQTLLDGALEIETELAHRLAFTNRDAADVGHPGLFRGWSGPAGSVPIPQKTCATASSRDSECCR